jgi:type I restriction enzyme S subunit
MKATANIAQIKKLSINKNDVIITKDSETIEEIAIPAIVTENFQNVVCGYHLAIIRSHKEKILGKYLFRLFQSKKFSEQFSVKANGVTRYGISTYPIKNIRILLPPKEEQERIVNYLNKHTIRIDKTIQKIKEKIKLLEEYKKSLIHHTVTGKIDVRGVC